MTQNWTIKRILDWTTDDFKGRQIPSPRLEAELLLGYLLNVQRLYLYTHFDRPLHSGELSRFRELVARRRSGECTAVIIGIKEFWSLDFEVNAHVLIPRPDTETLVQAALDVCGEAATILDLCTGTGCVAVVLATERKGATVHATDISEQALSVAQKNVTRHGLTDRVQLFQGDLFDAVPGDSRYNVIVANPPYVLESELPNLTVEVRNEPHLALIGGGVDGLDITRRLLQQATPFCAPGASILLELDDTQTIFAAKELGPSILGIKGETIQDLAGKNRVVKFQLP